MLLITISNDINPNPGPENSTVYPCGTRDQPVTWEERGIVCDTCNQWYHATCQSMWSTLYQEHVNNSAIAWDCLACGCPNYSTFCFPMVFSTSNQLSVLSNDPLVPLDSPTPSIPPTPIHASTPRRQNKPSIRANKADEHLRVLNVNFQSVKTKQHLLENLIDNTKPDVMFGTETWLDHGIKDSQYTYIATAVPELHTDCEIVWCKLELVGHKAVYLSCYYNPKTNNEASIQEFGTSMERAARINNALIIGAGDFNLPGWNWKKTSLKPNTQYPGIHHLFTDILDDYGLYQIVEEPTRGSNILDLIVTNYPASFRRTEIIP